MSSDPIFDDDNPEWTDEDFARATPAEELPLEFLSAFPKTLERLAREGRLAVRPAPAATSIMVMLGRQGMGVRELSLAA